MTDISERITRTFPIKVEAGNKAKSKNVKISPNGQSDCCTETKPKGRIMI